MFWLLLVEGFLNARVCNYFLISNTQEKLLISNKLRSVRSRRFLDFYPCQGQTELYLTPQFYIICNLPLTGRPDVRCQKQTDLSISIHPSLFPPLKSRACFELKQIHFFLPCRPLFIYFSPTAPYPSFIASSQYLLMILISQVVKGMSELGLYTNSLAAGMVTLISTWTGGYSCCTLCTGHGKRRGHIQTCKRWEWQRWHIESLHED